MSLLFLDACMFVRGKKSMLFVYNLFVLWKEMYYACLHSLIYLWETVHYHIVDIIVCRTKYSYYI